MMTPSEPKKKILVAMSGGVDSAVAGALLVEAGHEVAGATIRTWASNQCENLNTRACCGLTGVEDARDAADRLGIPYWVFNFEKEFKQFVVDEFASEYLKGRTPNPCISCNEHVKFRIFLQRARQLGFDFIATGHYARKGHDEASGRYYIEDGVDAGKDQSYVLFPLSQDILAHLFLPTGDFTKTEIRAKARALGLSVSDKPDSQEICFIPSNNYRDFMAREYPEKAAPGGVIRTRAGEVLGRHEGYFHYTRGQRRGLNVAAGHRLYVLETRPETNEVIVGTKDEIMEKSFQVGRLNWFLPPRTGEMMSCQVKIRSQHPKSDALVEVLDDRTARVTFVEAQDAITPGQGAVFYSGSRVMGGGWIDRIR